MNLESIAIDGPAASGKTSIGKLVAQKLDFQFLDTGEIYRALTWGAIEKAVGFEDDEALISLARNLKISLVSDGKFRKLFVNHQDITNQLRIPEVEHGVSIVSKVSGVRTLMVEQQRNIAFESPIVMVGRDVGTVVLPKANCKIYLDASLDVRAKRRYQQIKSSGDSIEYNQVLTDLSRRDKIDMHRSDSPLVAAPDAILLNTDELGIQQLADKILCIAKNTCRNT